MEEKYAYLLFIYVQLMFELVLDKDVLRIPREYKRDQHLVYSKLLVVSIADTSYKGIKNNISNKIILITIKKKNFRAREFKQKLLKQAFRLEVYPKEEVIYAINLGSYY